MKETNKEDQLLEDIQKYFKIQEFVGQTTFKKYGERAWRFMDFRLLETMLILRENLGRSITVNTWHNKGKFSQRGLRTIVQQIVKQKFSRGKLYLSAHLFGKAADFDVSGMSASEVRLWIIDNAHLFPYKIRLEAGVNWVHLDVIYETKNPKVYLFAP